MIAFKKMVRYLLAGMAGLGMFLSGCKNYHEGDYEPPALAYQGETTGLERTMIAATLDSPAEKGKNVIWCGSFQMAWDQMVKEVIGEPIQLSAAQEVVSRLNQNRMDETDLIPGGYYAAAGSVENGILEKIRRDMETKFPGVKVPPLGGGPEDLVAYGYLTVAVKFTTPYFDRQGIFTDGNNNKTDITGFSFFKGHNSVNDELVKQIEVLYTSENNMDNLSEPPTEFALDLCRTSNPCQIIIACVSWQDNLNQMVTTLLDNIKTWKNEEWERNFGEHDSLFVPNVNYDLTHHFRELTDTDNQVLNQGFAEYFIAKAFQNIRFRLDKSGALIASDSSIAMSLGKIRYSRNFLFDRPFLIIMRKRGAEKPFFVMWVDNAELLCKSGPEGAGKK